MDIDLFLKIATGAGGSILLLYFALRWLNSDRDKLLAALNLEREARIKALEESSARCAQDRIVLHQNIDELQKEVRALLKAMAGSAAKCGAECLKG